VRLEQLVYECDRCGACCERLTIQVEPLDALREPRIATAGKLLDGNGTIALEDARWSLNDPGRQHACVFLGADKACEIYASRPNLCVSAQAGGESCRKAREWAGLPALAAVAAEPRNVLDQIQVMCNQLESDE